MKVSRVLTLGKRFCRSAFHPDKVLSNLDNIEYPLDPKKAFFGKYYFFENCRIRKSKKLILDKGFRGSNARKTILQVCFPSCQILVQFGQH